ncbi:unnamed protein product [Caenorhabditis auriculariae]|uniref:PUB domain-containing protein n=1 Tax=Caenorhabditis auriculariae TaxID=2777116 RepID=A0A8S1HN67_9PELO|nr:unnamed protein product [Caenorhabditis auriculariae]
MIAQRELEEERRKTNESVRSKERTETDVREFDHSSAISGVCFTCELLGEDVSKPKEELMRDLEEFLTEQALSNEDDRVIPAVLMIYSLNKSAQKEIAIETLCKYLQNILEHPGEEKYQRIRVSNKAFQERVANVKGGRTFLESVDDGVLIGALEALKNGQCVPVKVSRCRKVFSIKEGQKIVSPKIPPDFYNLSAEELKKEQQMKTEQVERMLTLRTKEMRLKDDQLRNYKYKYTLIRVRIPGNFLLQGVFGCHEPVCAVRLFVANVLSEEASCCEFTLRDAAGSALDDDSASIADYGLAPAAVLHFDIAPIAHDILRDDIRDSAEPFSS